MLNKSEIASESMNASQLKIAVGIQEKEIARIEAETIGWKWNVRQKDMIHILGSRALHVAEGNELKPLTVREFERTFEEQWGVTLPAIQGDIKALVDAGMIEKSFLNGSKKTKSVQMTEHGFSIWREYANRRAALIYVMHDALNKNGTLPNSWRSRIHTWASTLFGDKAKAAAVVSIFLVLSATENDARAEFLSPNMTVTLSSVEVWETSKLGYSKTPSISYQTANNLVADYAVLPDTYVDRAPTLKSDQKTNALPYPGGDGFRIADRAGTYDALLPKTMVNLRTDWTSIKEWDSTVANFRIADRAGTYDSLLPKTMASLNISQMQ